MKLLHAPAADKSRNTPSKQQREYAALWATALDPARYPILSQHWPGPFLIDDRLAANDDSPLCRQFRTAALAGAGAE